MKSENILSPADANTARRQPPARLPAFGLTGGIASGKSTVARCLESLGAKIIDADPVGHELLKPGSSAYSRILSSFGPEILAAGDKPEIDRSRLAALVFADAARLRALNAILHPLILLRILEITAEAHQRDRRSVIVVEAPLIYEAGIEKSFLKVIVAWCRPEQQLERLVAKSSISRAQAEARIAAQMPPDQKRRRADYVMDCSTTIEAAEAQARALYPQLQQVMAELERQPGFAS